MKDKRATQKVKPPTPAVRVWNKLLRNFNLLEIDLLKQIFRNPSKFGL